ncbi:MAG: ribosome-associated translation inhibitor RaiA [Bacillota bacterium]|nr:MAG: ribosome-associated translation inhibitor RaiA [Bacillota bacterium]
MNISIYGKNVDVTDALKEYARKKVGKVAKYFDEPLQAKVTLSVERDRHIVEVTIPLPSSDLLLRAEEESDDMYASIDLVVDKLERQIRKYKTRINRKVRRPEGAAVAAAEPATDEEEWEEAGDEPRVVRTKRFAVKPMTVDEAILQMNLLGHDFFVFSNAATGEVNVVYRRKDGDYGLIEPEY